MSEPTRYEIRTVADFFAVPAASRENCLHDFRLWLDVMNGLNGMFGDVAGVHPITSVFSWVDDGKHDALVHITVSDTQPEWAK